MTTALILLRDWQDSQIEFWLPVVGFSDYDISSFGRVRSCKRKCTKIIGNYPHRQGYRWALLYDGLGRGTRFFVHQLVGRAFLARAVELNQVNHINCVKYDNRLGNLEWSNNALNQLYSFTVGRTARRGELHGMHKLNEDAVTAIRQLYAAGGYTHRELAQMYRVAKSQVTSIVNRKTWKYVA